MKKLFSLALTLFVVLASLSAHPQAIASDSGLTDRGEQAIEQIATCINSDGKNQLNILYLIDESGSLNWNDQDNLRVQGIKRSLEQFRDVSVSKPYFTVNRAITTFGSAFTVRKPWEKISGSSLDNDLEWIDSNIPKLNQGKFTDWNQGLKGSYEQFQKVKSASACNVMVWFTDGGVQVGNDSNQTRNSVAEICGADPLTGAKTGQEALIDKFRKSGINIQGVLLRNQKYIDDPSGVTGGKVSQEDLDNELARMSLFLPVVEQSGAVRNGAFSNGGPGTFNCGTFTGAGGVLQIVADAIDIIWPPIQFSCLSENGRIIPIAPNGQVKVDAALTRFTLTSPAKSFSVKNQSGAEIANARGASGGQVSVDPIGNSSSVVQVSGKVSSSNGVTQPGVWKIQSADLQRAVFCGFIDIGVSVSAGTCYIGENCDYSGTLTRFGRPIDFDSFQSVKVFSTQIDSQGKAGILSPLTVNRSTGEFRSSFTPQGNSDVANLKIAIKVVTETGIEYSLGTIKPIRVIPPGYYPEISPAPITKDAFSQNLIGKRGEALATLNLKGPSRTNGQICFGPLEVRADVNPNRIDGYVSQLDQKDLSDNPCFTLLAGSSQDVQLSIKNSDSADGNVAGYLTATLKSDGKEPIETKVDVQFATETQIDEGRFGLLLALFMFLGLALPLALLSIINSRNSRIVLDNVYRASIPVVFSSSGDFVNVSRLEKLGSGALLSQEDFSPFSSGKEVVRSKQIGAELLQGKTPKNPFGMLQAILTTSPGMVIASSAFGQSKKKLPSNQAQGSLNPSGLAFVTLTDSANSELIKENQGSKESTDRVEGTLTALLSLNSGDPVAQVDYLNTRIMHEGGWLNNLLSVSPAAPKVESPKKTKKSRAEKGVAAPTESGIDEWGSPASNSDHSSPQKSSGSPQPPSQKAPTDDWGSSSTNSDWDTPGSSGGSKEEW
jgi:hypothetical protein